MQWYHYAVIHNILSGIGIIDCVLPSLPAKLIRDHHRGALRIKQCQVGEVSPGFIHNIDEVRHSIIVRR